MPGVTDTLGETAGILNCWMGTWYGFGKMKMLLPSGYWR